MIMFNLVIAGRNFIINPKFLRCFIHQKSVKKEKSLNEKDSSLTLSYLINTCGLSHQSALSASTKLSIKTTQNPDFVIETLKSYDFTDAQITKLLTKHPRLLSCNVEDIVKPKLDYYLTLGYSRLELGKFIAKNPGAIMSSLEKRIKPNVELLRSIFLTNQNILKVVTQSSWLLMHNIKPNYLQIMKILEPYGVCHANVAKLVFLHPTVMLRNSDKFAQTVQSVKEFGFNPQSFMFVKALYVFGGLSPLSWEKKVDVFKSFGLSQKDVIAAFIKNPQCMALSGDRIRRVVEFFAKEMKWDPFFMVARSVLFTYSLEKRVIPRCSVMKVLASKGFVNHYPSVEYRFLMIRETMFLEKYVTKYKEQVPEVLDAFKVKLK